MRERGQSRLRTTTTELFRKADHTVAKRSGLLEAGTFGISVAAYLKFVNLPPTTTLVFGAVGSVLMYRAITLFGGNSDNPNQPPNNR